MYTGMTEWINRPIRGEIAGVSIREKEREKREEVVD